MSRNRDYEKLVGSDSDSGDEKETEESSDGEGSTESESLLEKTEIAKKSSSLPPVAEKKSQSQSSSKAPNIRTYPSSDEDESETESDEPGPKPVKIPEKSRDAAESGLDPRPRNPGSPVKSTGSKRPPPPENREYQRVDAKKSKKQQPEADEKKSGDDSKKQLFQRLWSEDDEVAVLKGMVDYAEKKKSDPIADLNAFHEFIKDDLHVDVSRAQLQDKIRRLKKKYRNNKSKEIDGKDRVFSKLHECRTYELSKQIWGSGNGKEAGDEELVGSSKVKGNSERKRKHTNASERGNVSGGLDLDSINMEMTTKRDTELSGGDKRGEEAEREWRKLRIRKIEVYISKLDLMCTQTRLVLDVLKFGDH